VKSTLLRPYSIFLAAGCILTFLIFFDTIDSWFVSDDYVIIGEIAESGYFHSWNEDSGRFIRPLAILSLMLDHQLWGFEPAGYHAFNLLLNLLCAFGVFILSRDIFRHLNLNGKITSAFFAGFLFLLLPSHAEPVIWISARADIMAACFAIFSVITFFRMLQNSSLLMGASSVLLFALGLAAKESVIILPLIWLILAVAYNRRMKKKLSGNEVIVIFVGIVLLTGYFVVRKILLGHFIGGLGSGRHTDVFSPGIIINLVRYCFRVFIPPVDEIMIAAATVLVLASVVIIAFPRILRRKSRSRELQLPFYAFLCFFVSLIPVLSLKIGVFDTQSERYLYFPGIFACIALALLIKVVTVNDRLRNGIMILLLVVSGTGLYSVSRRWIVAGELSQRISQQVAEIDPISSAIVNLPDHFRGAYVFRNGIDMAASIFQGNTTIEPSRKVLYHHEMTDLSERYSVESLEECIILFLPDSTIRFPKEPAVEYFFFDGALIRPVK
jgi:hypothetical protein